MKRKEIDYLKITYWFTMAIFVVVILAKGWAYLAIEAKADVKQVYIESLETDIDGVKCFRLGNGFDCVYIPAKDRR